MVGVSFLSAFSSPGATTIDSAERIGIRPVINEARPAVQLACPYQLVKTAPSLAMRSTLGSGRLKNKPRPAVQLACPYQLVKTAPSLAMRSTLGVGCPLAAPPFE